MLLIIHDQCWSMGYIMIPTSLPLLTLFTIIIVINPIYAIITSTLIIIAVNLTITMEVIRCVSCDLAQWRAGCRSKLLSTFTGEHHSHFHFHRWTTRMTNSSAGLIFVKIRAEFGLISVKFRAESEQIFIKNLGQTKLCDFVVFLWLITRSERYLAIWQTAQ